MSRTRTLARFALSVLVGSATLASAFAVADESESDVRVMSFNIRYGTANDGENRWDLRKDFVVDTVKAFDPDLLGTQETLAFQRKRLEEGLPGYEAFGAGRDDGKEAGEQTTLFFRVARFEKLDGGHFWLSEKPSEPGSVSWDSSLTRIASWVKLRDRERPDAKPLLFLNTHFDHRGVEARFQSAKLIRERLVALGESCRIVVTGDFNTGEGSGPYEELFGDAEGSVEPKASPIRDVYRLAHPERRDDEGSFSSFKAGAKNGDRIDWIGASPDFAVVSAAIDRTERDGRTPSDHFPVVAVLRVSSGD